ncbi:MAG: hypothetical protein A3G75_11110 [Verrucomicrobia bacterium RIFCSPLOWO2_12_FULL_64_8]|nr:MAG: hypothetical protein A3G75_11110 [Verrucomicrobia bacterium RIFCSPLOWO2_12_FULL_64_8]
MQTLPDEIRARRLARLWRHPTTPLIMTQALSSGARLRFRAALRSAVLRTLTTAPLPPPEDRKAAFRH